MQAWILRSFKMLSQEESTERFEDNNEDDDDFVTWDEYKANEFEDLEELEDGEQPDASKLEDMSMMEEDKVLFFVSSYPYFTCTFFIWILMSYIFLLFRFSGCRR